MVSTFTSVVIILLAIVVQSIKNDPALSMILEKIADRRATKPKPVLVQSANIRGQITRALVFKEIPHFDCWATDLSDHVTKILYDPDDPGDVWHRIDTFLEPHYQSMHYPDMPGPQRKNTLSKYATKRMITLMPGGKVKLRSHDGWEAGIASTKEYTYQGIVTNAKNPKNNGKLVFYRERRVTGLPQRKPYTMKQFQKKVDKGEVQLKDPSTTDNRYNKVNSQWFNLGTKKLRADYVKNNVKRCIVNARTRGRYGWSKVTKVDGLAHLEDDYSDALYQYDVHDDFHDYDEHGEYDDDDDAEDENYGGYEGYDDFREEMYDGDWEEGYTTGYHAAMQRLHRV